MDSIEWRDQADTKARDDSYHVFLQLAFQPDFTSVCLRIAFECHFGVISPPLQGSGAPEHHMSSG